MSSKSGSVNIFNLGALTAAISQPPLESAVIPSRSNRALAMPVATKQTARFCQLPYDVQSDVMVFLPLRDLLLRCNTVCRDWLGHIRSDKTLWEALYRRVQLPDHTYADVAEDSAAAVTLKTLKLFRAQLNLPRSLFTNRPIQYDNPALRGWVAAPSKGTYLMNDDSGSWLYLFQYRAGQMRQTSSLKLFSSKEYRPEGEGCKSTHLVHDEDIHAISNRRVMKIWKQKAGRWHCHATYPAPITPMCLYDSMPGRGLKMYDEDNAQFQYGQLSGHGSLVTVEFHDATEADVIDDDAPWGTTVKMWDWKKDRWKEQTLITRENVSNTQFLPNEDLLTTHPNSNTTKVWRRQDDEWICIETLPFIGCRIAKDRIVSYFPNGKVVLWNYTTHQEEAVFTLPPSSNHYRMTSYLPHEAIFETTSPYSCDHFMMVYRKVNNSWNALLKIQTDTIQYQRAYLPTEKSSLYSLNNGNFLAQGAVKSLALWDMSASEAAVLAQIQESTPIDDEERASKDTLVDSAKLKHFFTLPLAITRPIYKMLLERKFPHLLTAPDGLEKSLAPLPKPRYLDSVDILPPAFALHYMENPTTKNNQEKLKRALALLQRDLQETLAIYLKDLCNHPSEIGFELAMAHSDDHSAREFYLKKYHSLSADKQAAVRARLAEFNALKKLNPIPWTAEEIAQAFALPINDNPASTAYLLHKFSILPEGFKNAVYGQMYRIHRPTKEKDVPRYGEFAFLRQHNFDATNKDRAKVIEAVLKTLAKIPQ